MAGRHGQGRGTACGTETKTETESHRSAEGLRLRVADNKTGYFGVHLDKPGLSKPYKAQLSRGGKTMYLGNFATAEEAALCIARSPEGQAAAERAAAEPSAPPLTSEEARQQAQVEGLTLRVTDNTAGYFGVSRSLQASIPKPYAAQVRQEGKTVYLGNFATAEEAALCVARSPEGWAAVAGSGAVGGESGKALCRAVWRHPQVEAATRAWVSAREAEARTKRLARLAEERKKMDGFKAAARRGGAGPSVSSMLPGCSVLARGVPSSAPVCASAPVSASARAPVLAAAVAVRSSAALPFAVVVPRGKAAKQAAAAAGGSAGARRSAGAHR